MMRVVCIFISSFLCVSFLNSRNSNKTADAMEFSISYNIEERQFIVKSWTGINGVWPPWDLPKFCHAESWISNNYEGGAWQNHYVRCYFEDHRHDTRRCWSSRVMDGFYAGWYHAEANSQGSVSDGTGYSFYGN